MISASQLIEAARALRELKDVERLRDIVAVLFAHGIIDRDEIIEICGVLQQILPSNMIGILCYVSSLHRMGAAYDVFVLDARCPIAPIDAHGVCFASTIGEEP